MGGSRTIMTVGMIALGAEKMYTMCFVTQMPYVGRNRLVYGPAFAIGTGTALWRRAGRKRIARGCFVPSVFG